ncbi:hypothetical protein LTR84_000642 [Exophiala bonariae]|uniref:UBC core domain-containing protein n=1 Tax=Exophiala bonariae TaxID=1690606 RepID=A0AAV9NUV3_9EURO|nr:hypothetical protein LTR84_000642 [Exophiala bonariae]
MQGFALYDCVFLKDNPSLCGIIERSNTDAYEPLDDDLIIGHADVPIDILNNFIESGVPPPGYYYVEFEDESCGKSLVGENDIELLCRTFQIGDSVKREGSPMTGTVINLSESYLLAPVLSCPGYFKSPYPNPQSLPTCGPNCQTTGLPPHIAHPNPHVLIRDVPAREVRRAQDLVKDDYLLALNWVGRVEDVSHDVVICMENKAIVVLRTLDGLYLPVKDYGKPLIALPEREMWRPDGVGTLEGWSQTVPLIYPRVGQFVVADRYLLRRGRWIRGSYDANASAQGTILEIRAGEAAVHWEQHSFSSTTPDSRAPPYELELYENSQQFKSSADLRLRTDMIVYDSGKMPSKHDDLSSIQDTAQTQHRQKHPGIIDTRDICAGQDIGVGDHVRFRDLTAAAVKYTLQGAEKVPHGSLLKFDPNSFYGWDLNEFKILHIHQLPTVLWQDGSVTTVESSEISGYALFEPELAPTDIVLKREGMRQRAVVPSGQGQAEVKEFNEMAFFESPHDLLPEKVGVIQTVDSIERVATVRWFKEPHIELRTNGQTLSSHSRYGPIGDDIEDVSLYEIMTFPSLQRKLRDMCIIAPDVKRLHIKQGKDDLGNAVPREPLASASTTPTSAPKVFKGWSQTRTQATTNSKTDVHNKALHSIDWFGEIVALGLDGSNTVRLGGQHPCREIHISFDRVLALLDSDGFPDDTTDDNMDLDSLLFGSSDGMDVEPIEQTVEYEGGHRLDNDSDSENWESEGTGIDLNDDAEFADAREEQTDSAADVEMTNNGPIIAETKPQVRQAGIIRLSELIADESPAQFAVLEQEPPPDQFGLHSVASAGSFLKRIVKEHRALATSLPIGEIYVRTYESRLDLLRCIIIGPRDTPYESAPFVVDLYLPDGYPASPPTAHFHSWTSGLGRINPNLYEEGKICLSLLGTWSGKNETEKWSESATILQLLVSLQGLVLVKRPFYNEAGFEGYEHDKAYTRESELYSEKAFLMARGFVKYAMTQPPGGLEDVLSWIYLSLRNAESTSLLSSIIANGRTLIQRSEEARKQKDDRLMDAVGQTEDETRAFLKPLSLGAAVMLKRTMNELEGLLGQL